MRTVVAFGVWVYMVVAVLSEVAAFYAIPSYAAQVGVILTLAASQAVAIVLFYMQLKEEPGGLRLFALIPLMFLAALIIAMLASLG